MILNESREMYKSYKGKNTEQMPKLIDKGRVPISVAGLMQRRLAVRNSDADVKTSYMYNYFDTGDAIVYHPDGRVKIVLDSHYLREMTPETSMNAGALIFAEDVYRSLDGEEFKKGKLGRTADWLSKRAAKAHPIWKALARDQALLNDYADYIFAENKEMFNNDTGMGILMSLVNGKTPEMRDWYVEGLGGKSNVCGRGNLNSDYSCLIGVTPGVINGAGKAEAYNVGDLRAFVDMMNGLEGTLHQDVLKPVADLRNKL